MILNVQYLLWIFFFRLPFFWSVIQWNLCNSKAVYKVSTCDLNDRMFRDLQTVCRDAIDRLPCWRLKWLYSIAVWVECSKKKVKIKTRSGFWIYSPLQFRANLKLPSSKCFSCSSSANNKSSTMTNMLWKKNTKNHMCMKGS